VGWALPQAAFSMLVSRFSRFSRSDWLVVLFAVAAFAAYSAFKAWRERSAQSWPIVQGTVEWTQVRIEQTDPRHEERIPEVCYSYIVNGEYYSGSHEISQVELRKYPKGSLVLVHYKPSNPSVSFLDRHNMRAHEDAEAAAE
jgi:hypothetical protein